MAGVAAHHNLIDEEWDRAITAAVRDEPCLDRVEQALQIMADM